MTIGNLVRNAVQHGTGVEVVCRSQGRELMVSNAGALPPDSFASFAAPLHDAPERPRHGPVPGAPHLRALRLGDPAGKQRRGVVATVGFEGELDHPLRRLASVIAFRPPEIPPFS